MGDFGDGLIYGMFVGKFIVDEIEGNIVINDWVMLYVLNWFVSIFKSLLSLILYDL